MDSSDSANDLLIMVMNESSGSIKDNKFLDRLSDLAPLTYFAN
jgi:hypothetical protein